jgi:hypothetical protein
MKITKEIAEAVLASKCFACGAYPFEQCRRNTFSDCGREHTGGTREPVSVFDFVPKHFAKKD